MGLYTEFTREELEMAVTIVGVLPIDRLPAFKNDPTLALANAVVAKCRAHVAKGRAASTS